MGFYSDFIETVQHELAADQRRDPDDARRLQMVTFSQIASHLQRAKIVRLRGEQAQLFLDTPPVEGQDYVQWLRLPFDRVYLHFDPPMRFTDYLGEEDHAQCTAGAAELLTVVRDHGTHQCQHRDPRVKGVLLCQGEPGHTTDRSLVPNGIRARVAGPTSQPEPLGAGMAVPSTATRILQIIYLMPLPEYFLNVHASTVVVMPDNTLRYNRLGFWRTRKRMIDWAVHAINFLSSPSVKLVREEPPAPLQKARAKAGKPPLPGWYEITYRKVINDYGKEKISTKEPAWRHSFRYDVRGHTMRFTRGRMAGRVIWCPPHQRGLRHALYKPKTYRTEPDLREPDDHWRGD